MDIHACLLRSPDHDGWLIDGAFLASEQTGFPLLENEPASQDLWADLRCLEAEQESSQALIDQGHHPEWHRYEISQSAFREDQQRLRHVLFAQGAVWIRLEYGRAKATGRQQALAAWDLEGFEIEEIADKALRAYLPKIPVDPLLGPDMQGTFLNAEQEAAWARAVEGLLQKGYGWVSPDRQVLICDLHEHLKIVEDTGAEPALFEAIEHAKQDLLYAKTHSMHNDGRDEDQRLQTLKNQLVETLYQAGWIRLAVFQDHLNAEGRKRFIKPVSRMLTMLAQDARCRFFPRYV